MDGAGRVEGLHLVLGAGTVGSRLVVELLAAGARVRVLSRRARPDLPSAAEVVLGDAFDAVAVAAAARGAGVVHQVLSPPYHRWPSEFPALQAAAVTAARSAGARLVALENVYLYGRPGGRVLTEDSPHAAHTRNGRVREQLADELERLRADGGDRMMERSATRGRASPGRPSPERVTADRVNHGFVTVGDARGC